MGCCKIKYGNTAVLKEDFRNKSTQERISAIYLQSGNRLSPPLRVWGAETQVKVDWVIEET